jgi:hypothetical protein
MRGRYSAIASSVSIRSAGALVLLAGVGGLFLVSRALERRQAIDFAPLVVPPGRVAAPSMIFAPFVARQRARPGARAQPPSQRSTSGSDLSQPIARGRPAASVQLPVGVLPGGGDRRSPQPPQTAPGPPAAPAPSAPLEPGRSAANPGSPGAQTPGSRQETSSAAAPAGAPTPPAAPPTRPGRGHGDTNHSHTGPPGKNAAPSPPAPPPRQDSAVADSQGSAATPNPQPGGDTNHRAAGPPARPQPDQPTPSAPAENAPAAGGNAHDDSAPRSSPHGG